MVNIRLSEEQEGRIGEKAERMGMGLGEFLKWLGLNVELEVDLRVRISQEISSVEPVSKRYKVETVELSQPREGRLNPEEMRIKSDQIEEDKFGIGEFLAKKGKAVVPKKVVEREKLSVESPEVVEGFTFFPEEEVSRKKFYELTGLEEGTQLTGKYQEGWGVFVGQGKFDESLRA